MSVIMDDTNGEPLGTERQVTTPVALDLSAPDLNMMPDLAAAMADTDRVPYMIVFDDNDRESEMVVGGTRARYRYRQISQGWNAHLYVKINSNSRDCPWPDAEMDGQGGGFDISDADVIALCKSANINWVGKTPSGSDYLGPDECFDGPISMSQMKALLQKALATIPHLPAIVKL
jgi:hypothetical protein